MSRKDQIINALIDRFSQEGFNIDFTMSELANDVNIGKSTIYEYFSNKDEVLKEALITYVHQIIADIHVVKNLDDYTFEEAFKAQLKALFEAGFKSRTVMETFTPRFMKNLPDEVRVDIKKNMEISREIISKRFVSFFEKGIREGILNLENSLNNAIVVRSLIVGAVMNFSDPDVLYDTNQAVDEVYQAMLKLVQ